MVIMALLAGKVKSVYPLKKYSQVTAKVPLDTASERSWLSGRGLLTGPIRPAAIRPS